MNFGGHNITGGLQKIGIEQPELSNHLAHSEPQGLMSTTLMLEWLITPQGQSSIVKTVRIPASWMPRGAEQQTWGLAPVSQAWGRSSTFPRIAPYTGRLPSCLRSF